MKLDTLRLQHSSSKFNLFAQKSIVTQIWVRFYKLPLEYWSPKLLSDIARGIGIPLKVDKATAEGDFGHCTRVLVEMDISVKPIDRLMIQRMGKSFFLLKWHMRICQLSALHDIL